MKKILGIDIDGVLADSDRTFRKYLGLFFKKEFKREDVFNFSYEESFNIPREKMREYWIYFYENGGWDEIEPLHNAKQSIDILKDKYRIIIVTGRPAILEQVTISWLNKYDFYYKRLFLTNFKDKFQYLIENGHRPEWFVEDHLQFSLGLATNGVKVLLFNYPWNSVTEGDLHKNIFRVKNWDDVLKYLMNGKK